MKRPRPSSSTLARALTLAVLALGFVAVLAANLPGHLSYDSLIQLHDGRTGQYHSWHPPIMAWTLGWLDALLPGPALFVVLDAGLFFASLAALATASRKTGWAAPLCAGLISLSPLVLIYQAIVWKDVFYADCSVAGFVCLSLSDQAERSATGRDKGGLTLVAAAFVLFGLATLIRQNGVVTLAAGACAVVWTAWRGRVDDGGRGGLARGLTLASFALVLTLGGVFVAGRALDTRRVDEPGAAAQFKVLQGYDVIGAVAHDTHMDLTALTVPPNGSPGLDGRVRAAARKFYSPTRVDTLARDPGLTEALADAAPAVSAQWRWMLGHDLKPYLQHRLAVFGWTLFTPDLNRCLPVFTGIAGRPDLIAALGLTGGARLQDAALWRYAAAFFHTPVFSHAAYCLVALVAAVVLLGSRRAGDAAMGFMLLGALAFTASFLIVSVACDYRYLYALDLSAMTAVFYLAVHGPGWPAKRGRRGAHDRLD